MYNMEVQGFNSSEATTWIMLAFSEPDYSIALFRLQLILISLFAAYRSRNCMLQE
jgi:hypothetical protein